ncbi:hypothetical protein GGX14DRAFT_383480 [Mycena pura]|uniref:Poly [ADP-ribose] polymerase n=1 Tax=Mycena pura TaxID=153505 RepID=A0AAD6UJU8_9AGAR|nr:hypothetical protein GGX14DRAFT_383480 [Mycena pura]
MRLWHGTHRSCEIGANGNTTLCHHSSCGICNILRNSFDVAKAKQTNMFGKGIYFSQASHKASQYSNKVKGRKAMLLCYVTAGNPLYLDSEARYLGPPGPPGHDSVYATPGPNLKYHEIVSYRNASMRPGYLVTHVSH